MTTLTTRPLPLLPLALPRSMTCNERSSSSTGSSTPPQLSSLAINGMHPDNLLLPGHHGVTSPRLGSAGSVFCENSAKNCDSSPHLAISVQTEDYNIVGREKRSLFDAAIVNRSDISENSQILSNNADEDNGTDEMSCCSDDSELSVGQEGCASNNGSEQNLKSLRETVDSASSTTTTTTTTTKQVVDDSESVDNISNLSDENRCLGSIGEQLVSDDMSNDSSPNREIEPPLMTTATGLRIPVPIVRPSPTRLQEEFLRKSHLYAEELMKQQMQFMAAARASAFSLRHAAISPDMGKVGFRPHVKSTSMQSADMNEGLVNFSGIHSHLSAISKISSQLTGNDSALSKLTAFGVVSAREMTQSPPFSNPLHINHPAAHSRHAFINNNLNETNLKFSIDNILKADFGRRITDPLLKRNNSSSGGASGKGQSFRKNRNSEKSDGAPVDLTNLVTGSAAGNSSSVDSSLSPALDKQQLSSRIGKPLGNSALTSATTCSVPSAITTQSATSTSTSSTSATATSSETSSSSSSSGSGGPMVWPAWVYCTRYSDRPSSGPRSSGPRTRKPKKPPSEKGGSSSSDEKRPRTAFSGPQLARLKHEFSENRYLTERRRQQLSAELGLNEAQIKIWFQNKRAKIKKASGTKNPLALQLMAQGLYNHSTVPLTREEEELQELQANKTA